LLSHHELLWRIGGYEPDRGANVAGHRGYFLKDVGVLLNQAFINYGIQFLRKKNYCVLQPPFMMKKVLFFLFILLILLLLLFALFILILLLFL
jgi:seryl-tRNA synthetase